MNSRKGPKISRFFPFLPTDTSGHREQTTSWRTGLYGDGKTALAAAGLFFGPEKKVKRQKAKGKRIAAAFVAALFESPALCRHSANVEGRGAAGSRCDVSQFQNGTALLCLAVTELRGFARILVRDAIVPHSGSVLRIQTGSHDANSDL